ncbi:MAG: patatin-like phospholipase family protein [Christensenellales bacterium]
MENNKDKKLKIGIALGGGFLCSMSHIGFLQVLEENGIKPDIISGVSMGAIIGAFYAGGYSLKEIEDLATSIKRNDLITINAFRILKEGLASTKKVEKFLDKKLKVKTFEELSIPLFAGATDLRTGKPYYFKSGNLIQALRASSSVPGFFQAVEANGTAYVDGGISENVPFKVLKKENADVVIALDCINPYENRDLPKNSIATQIQCSQLTQSIANAAIAKMNKDKYDIYCIDSTEGVTPDQMDFEIIPRLIESGRQCALKNLDQIKEIIKNKEKVLENTCKD